MSDLHPAGETRPLLTVTSELSVAVYEKALRHNQLKRCAVSLCALVGLMLLADVVFSAYYAAADHLPFTELLLDSILHQSTAIWILYAVLFAVFVVMMLVIEPRQMVKRVREIAGDTWRQTLTFTETLLHVEEARKSGSGAQDFPWGQIVRIRNRKYDILIRTGGKNGVSVFKEVLKPGEEQKILEILRAHCPAAKGL